jgi:hypothetical protein
MSVDDRVVTVVRGWIGKAENDLKTAAHTLKISGDCPTDTICFHAQQCVEKCAEAPSAECYAASETTVRARMDRQTTFHVVPKMAATSLHDKLK